MYIKTYSCVLRELQHGGTSSNLPRGVDAILDPVPNAVYSLEPCVHTSISQEWMQLFQYTRHGRSNH